MTNYTYEQILEMDDLSLFTSEETIDILGRVFDNSERISDSKTLAKWVNYAETINIEVWETKDLARFYYFLSNGWSYRKKLRLKSPNNIEFYNEETVHALRYTRLALQCCNISDGGFLKSQLLVNLGCTLSHLGRGSEAILYWQEALLLNSNFGMAIGNLGYGVFHYGKMLSNITHVVLFSQYAHRLLLDACDSDDVYDEAKCDFRGLIESIENVVGNDDLQCKFNLSEYNMGESEDEIDYREWCLFHKLYLNYVNDIYREPIAAHDCLLLPCMQMKFGEPLIHHDIFNQIKQEFSSARYFIYRGISDDTSHFADKNNAIVNTMDMSEYSHNIEMLKSGFRMCYSILDKIALFVNSYFKIGVKIERVSFSKIWYKKNGIDLKDEFINSKNWLLRGLYWLSRDFHSDNLAIANPDAQDIAKIRNYIEHRLFKVGYVHEMLEQNDGITLEIDRYYFEDKCIKTISLVRSAIIYLSLAVKLEEDSNKKEESDISCELDIVIDNDKK